MAQDGTNVPTCTSILMGFPRQLRVSGKVIKQTGEGNNTCKATNDD